MDTNTLTNTVQRAKYAISALLKTNGIASEQNCCLKNVKHHRNNVEVTMHIKIINYHLRCPFLYISKANSAKKKISAWLVKESSIVKHNENEKTKSSFWFTRQMCINLSQQNWPQNISIKINMSSCNIWMQVAAVFVNAKPFCEMMLMPHQQMTATPLLSRNHRPSPHTHPCLVCLLHCFHLLEVKVQSLRSKYKDRNRQKGLR